MTNLLSVSLNMLPNFLLGMVLGLAFFLTLWFTVRQGLLSKHPAKWFLGGLLLRMSIVLVGFYVVAKSGWLPILTCLLGFIIARELVQRLWVFRRPGGPSSQNTEHHNAH